MTHFINGSWQSGKGKLFDSFNPATGKILWSGHEAESECIHQALLSGKKAFEKWSKTSLSERISYLNAFSNVLNNEKTAFAEIISQENGKPLWESLSEVNSLINKVSISIEAYKDRCPNRELKQPLGTLKTTHRPHGVLAVLSPFNFPAHMPNSHIVPAILAGNTVILKPSEYTPMTAQFMVQCWEKSDLPKGVINLVQGGRSTGKLLSEHPLIEGLLFTGSFKTGTELAQFFAKTPHKILSLEMGGNNPLIVSDINDITSAAYTTIQSSFLTSGQRCTCARRLIIPYGILGDTFLKKLIEMTKKIKIGPYTETPEPYMGPLISLSAVENLIATEASLIKNGGIPLLSLSRLNKGPLFLSPALIDTTHILDRKDEEYFGPLLQVIRVKDFKEALIEANNTLYGLSAGLLSENKKEYESFYNTIRTGLMSWNTQMTGASSLAPFGGIGRSGNNRPSAYYAADSCAFPFVSLEQIKLEKPSVIAKGITYE